MFAYKHPIAAIAENNLKKRNQRNKYLDQYLGRKQRHKINFLQDLYSEEEKE